MTSFKRLFLIAILCIINAVSLPLHAGKLDINLYSSTPKPPPTQKPGYRLEQILLPGDPRSLRGESRSIQRVSHIGYATLGLAGLAGSVATGGIGPAIGFGIVALIHGIGLLGTRDDAPRQSLQPTRAEKNKS